ncbi:hypothetical protein [Pedosphaera parvula]|uniref:Peptidase C39-like domain-containing protein n=1 Tax=Pedosphaera parvula (strain Ellin514) TaxID=320771 RepID=B9XJ24_PEDPL|nr:hypothetical protein [Pedosphaera parvula]EEF60251.1 hypothetical protein Cflav_PD3310 [Pedosphaera parvula Ellin514]
MRTPTVNLILICMFCSLLSVINAQETKSATQQKKTCLTKFNAQIVDDHKQIYDMSCIPMSIEMVLKLLDRVPGSYYDLQNPWKNKMDGNFSNFDSKTIEGVTFHKQYGLARNDKFPLTKLFETIDHELKAGRFVIVSLVSSSGWHMWVIYDEDADGDFLAVSKAGSETLKAVHVKKTIKDMKGTDIMTYELKP